MWIVQIWYAAPGQGGVDRVMKKRKGEPYHVSSYLVWLCGCVAYGKSEREGARMRSTNLTSEGVRDERN
jgi:hypothetical protein